MTGGDDDFRSALISTANQIGADPADLATVISYETGGTFSPSIMGGSGGKYLGLIQFGPNEQKQYGASADQTPAQQLGAVGRYLTDRGFQPGMGMMDLYSTINAGSPGRYNASDAGNGGAPGTVADKVNNQMGAHRDKALAFLGGSYAPPAGSGSSSPVKLAGFGALPTPAPPAPDTSDADAKAVAALTGNDPTSSAAVEPATGILAPRRASLAAATTGPTPFDASRLAGLLTRRKPANGPNALV